MPEQAVCSGAQLPRHTPSKQVWFTHATGSLHVPSDVQTRTPLEPPQIVLPAAHEPEQVAAPPETTQLAPVPHETASFHVPLDEQLCRPLPAAHRDCPGVQSVQTDPTHPSGQNTAPVQDDSDPSSRHLTWPAPQSIPVGGPPSGVAAHVFG